MSRLKVGMIGVGNMASAIAKAIVRAVPTETLLLANRTPEKIQQLVQDLAAKQITMEQVGPDLIEQCDLIFVGVKPTELETLFKSLTADIQTTHPITWVSMASNVSLTKLESLIPAHHQWIRIMPNTPVEVGQGYTSYCYSKTVSSEVLERFKGLMSQSGVLAEIDETQFDAASGMAGCSPAFIYQLIEAMSDAGVAHGLKRNQSIEMAAQAVKGAASMVLETDLHPAQLKDAVTSPGGTTITGVTALEAAGFRSAIIQGVTASIEKTRELQE